MNPWYAVSGLNPINGQIIDLIIVAPSAMIARDRAEECGLRCVTLTLIERAPPPDVVVRLPAPEKRQPRAA